MEYMCTTNNVFQFLQGKITAPAIIGKPANVVCEYGLIALYCNGDLTTSGATPSCSLPHTGHIALNI
jgi:hypothetical protein